MRWIIRVLGALVLLAVLAVAALFALPTERIAALAADRISAATGREVRLEGEVRPTLWPHLGVRAEAFTIGNPDWVEDGPLLSAEALDIRVPWSAVLAGAVEIEAITLIAPEITLVQGADGRVSWTFDSGGADGGGSGPAPDDPATQAAGPGFALSQAQISDGRLLYRDLESGQTVRIAGLDGDIRLPRSGPASAELTAEVNGTALELSAAIDGLEALLQGGVRPVALALGWSGGQAAFDGALSLSPALDGDLTLSATDLGPLAALAGQSAPQLPEGLGRDQIGFAGHVTLASEGSVHLREARLTLDDTPLGLALDIMPGEDRPTLRGTLTGGALRLPGLAAGGEAASGSGAGPGGGGGWPTDPIDVSGLFAADADVAIALQSVDLGQVAVGPVDLRATLTGGRLVFDIDRVGIHGGALAGQFVVNGRGGLSVGGDLILADVQLSPLLQQLADYDRLDGTGSASLQFLGVGNDMATIMSGLQGQGDMAFGAGAILGLDIAGMIRNFDTSFRGEGARTVYDRITANFTIADGILQNDDLRLDAPWGEVTGAGRADLGAQTLDYRVIPGVMRDDSGTASIRVPVLITGPWANLSFRPDLEYLAEQELAEEAERLETEARERLAAEADRLEAEARERANELLGTDLQEGDTVDDATDALEQRLRDEAEAQLRRLLGGN